jgi:3-oxoisoapionate decarboxylase
MTNDADGGTRGNRMHGFGLAVYGLLYATGMIGRGTPLANPQPLDGKGFLDLAVRRRLSVVEVPSYFLVRSGDQPDGRDLSAFRDAAAEAGIRIVVAGPLVLETDAMIEQIRLCRDLGVTVLRCTMSRLLCGDRSSLGGREGWLRHVSEVVHAVRRILPEAEHAGVTIAVENHQDADAETLAEICRSCDSPFVGVTLDTGNPLAVGQDPVQFAERVLPHVADVHLKDYRMIQTTEGFRLVHCAIGDGVVDFDALWRLLAAKPSVPRTIEMAAWNERHIKLLTPEWWNGYGERDVRSLVPVIRLLLEKGERDPTTANGGGREWRTPLELGDTSRAREWEDARLERSIENLAAVETRALRSTSWSGSFTERLQS